MAKTEKLYVLGHPVAHSKSPAMYNAVYEKLGLGWHYDLMDCETEDKARAFLAARDFVSINITTPYKPLAFEAASARAASARLAKGANLLVRKGDVLIAYNTDGQGCVACIERLGFSFAGKKVVVCGTGPTSLAILHAAAQAGAAEVVLLGRDKAKAEKVLRAYADEFSQLAHATIDLPAAKSHHLSFRQTFEQAKFKFGAYESSRNTIAGADLIVDATPLGMKAGDLAPFDTGLLSAGQTVLDVVYGHGETALAAAAGKAGCVFADGRGMLVGQAVVTFEIVRDICELDCALSSDELFSLMAAAAGFDCA